MKLIIILLAVADFSLTQIVKPSYRINYGVDVYSNDVGLYEHYVNLGGCGGSLISNRLILTAAHCLYDKDPITKVKYERKSMDLHFAMLSMDDLHDYSLVYRRVYPHQWHIHSGYHPELPSDRDDMAMIVLDTADAVPINDKVKLIPLPTTEICLKNLTGSLVEICGYGRTENTDKESFNLKTATVRIQPDSQCNVQMLFRRNSFNMICTLGDELQNANHGDSGGPMVYTDTSVWPAARYLIGVASFGISSDFTKPSVYTRVCSYMTWINDFLRKTGGVPING